MGVLQGNGELQLQLGCKAGHWRQRATGEQNAPHLFPCQHLHCKPRQEAPESVVPVSVILKRVSTSCFQKSKHCRHNVIKISLLCFYLILARASQTECL